MTPMVFATTDFGLSFILEWVALVVIVVIVVRKFPLPQLRGLMSTRLEAIHAQLVASDKARRDAERTVAECSAALGRARTEAATIVSRAERNAEHLLANGRERADGEYALAVTRAQIAIELARAQIRAEEISEVGALVVAVAAKVVAAELDDREHHRLIGEAIAAAETERAS
jgi:F-type H+-transporting ATPase subunit b